jgi:hypothetical protein
LDFYFFAEQTEQAESGNRRTEDFRLQKIAERTIFETAFFGTATSGDSRKSCRQGLLAYHIRPSDLPYRFS